MEHIDEPLGLLLIAQDNRARKVATAWLFAQDLDKIANITGIDVAKVKKLVETLTFLGLITTGGHISGPMRALLQADTAKILRKS